MAPRRLCGYWFFFGTSVEIVASTMTTYCEEGEKDAGGDVTRLESSRSNVHLPPATRLVFQVDQPGAGALWTRGSTP